MKILLVDDSKSARYTLRLQLQRYGIAVTTADSAEAAFAWLESALPDAIFLDHLMPGLNGLEALERLRAQARTAAIPVVMCHSQQDAEFQATAGARGAFSVLPKCDAEQRLPALIQRLRDHLGGNIAPAEPESVASVVAAEASVPAATEHPPADIIRLLDADLAGRLPPLFEALRRDLRGLIEIRLEQVAERFRRTGPERGQADSPSVREIVMPDGDPVSSERLAALEDRVRALESANADLRESLEILRHCQHRASRRYLLIALLIFAFAVAGFLLFG